MLTLSCEVLAKVCVDYFTFNISPVFGKYGIDVVGQYFSESYIESWIAGLIVMTILALYLSTRKDVLDLAISFLCLATFLPASTVYWVSEGSLSFFLFCAVFWSITFCLFGAVRMSSKRESLLSYMRGKGFIGERCIAIGYSVVVLALLAVLVINFNLTLSIGFETAYIRRSAFSEWLEGSHLSYLFGWSVYVLSVYLIFIPKGIIFKLIGILFVMAIYSIAGDKIYLFLIILLAFLNVIKNRYYSSFYISFCFVILPLSGIVFYLNSGSIWVSAIVNRFLALPFGIAFNYIDYFKNQHLAYSYSFLSDFSKYPYSELPAKLIGDMFYIKGDNANVNFLADAFVNFGWLSIFYLVAFFIVIRISLHKSRYLLIACPLFFELINIPLPTALLTGGGGIMLLVCLCLEGKRLLINNGNLDR